MPDFAEYVAEVVGPVADQNGLEFATAQGNDVLYHASDVREYEMLLRSRVDWGKQEPPCIDLWIKHQGDEIVFELEGVVAASAVCPAGSAPEVVRRSLRDGADQLAAFLLELHSA